MTDRAQYGTIGVAGVEAMEASTARSFPRHTHEHFSQMESETRLLSLVGRLVMKPRPRNVTTTFRASQLARARRLIDDSPAAPLSLSDLAAAARLSRFQLIRGFAREVGLTPHAYVVQRRLDMAKRMLKAGRSIAETAFEAGFSDQSRLTRAFVRQFGTTPSRYREQAR